MTKTTPAMKRTLTCLDELKMEAARAKLPAIVEKATTEGVEFIEGLGALLDEEVLSRRERRLNRRIKEARLPELKTLDDFNFTFPEHINEAQIRALTQMTFVAEALNVIISGKSGTGKSHIGMSLGLLACGHDYRVRYTSCAHMLNDLYAALADQTLERKLRRYTSPDLLIIDDLGTEKVEIIHGQGASLFFKVVNSRYGVKSTLITSNLDTDLWAEYFGDPNVTVAALDRFTHHAIPIVIDGESYRVRMMEERMAAMQGEKKTKKLKSKTSKKK